MRDITAVDEIASLVEANGGARTKRIVLTTFGSLGDLHPYIALAIELRERGHRPVIATNNTHRPIVEAEGIPFYPVRPDLVDFDDEQTVMKKVWHLRSGPEFLIREIVMPYLRESYEDLSAACENADLLVSHPLTLTAPLVAEKKQAGGMTWASIAITPQVFLSKYDPPVFAPAPWLIHLKAFGPRLNEKLIRAVVGSTQSWVGPWHKFKREIGIPSEGVNPLFGGQMSPRLTLATFSSLLAGPQPDWPENTVVTGFPFYDRRGERSGLSAELDKFLDAGEPPIVFTLGSAAVMQAGSYYAESAEAARLLGRRALLLVGKDPRNRPSYLPKGVAAFEYAPFSQVFPRACAVVHQGGIGTTAQAMRAGTPSLIVPFGFDQPDNAARIVRLGVGRTLSRKRYTAERAAKELQILLTEPRYVSTAAEIARQVRRERGAAAACDALESLMGVPAPDEAVYSAR